MACQPNGTWKEEIRIRSYDVDFAQQATVEAVCRFFLEAAWNHAEALGFGFAHLAAQGRLWVLSRLLLKFERYPRWGELVTLNTWPRAAKGVFALREFEILDSARKQICGGSSAWVVLDAQTKKPQRIDKWLSGIRTGPDRLAVDGEPAKIPACSGPVALTKTARYSDIDLNGHVNSGRYIEFLLDLYSLDFHGNHQAQMLEINYLGETKGDASLSFHSCEEIPGTWSHSIEKAGGAEVCRARIVWTRRSSE